MGLPGEFMNALVWEGCTINDPVVIQTEANKALTIVTDFTTAMFPHGSVTPGGVSSNLGIHVPSHHEHVMLRHLGYGKF